MSVKELITKALVEGVDKLTAEERAALEGYQEIDAEKLANDRAGKARLEAERKAAKLAEEKAAVDQQLLELQAKIDEASGKEKSELEKMQAKLEKVSKDMETEKAERAKAQAENARLVRDHKIDQLFAGIAPALAEGVDRGDVRALLGLRLAEVDLADDELVGVKLEEFRGRNKGLFLAAGAGGSGAGGGGAGGNGGGGRQGPVDLAALLKLAASGDPAEAEKALKAAQAAIAGGAKTTGG